MPNMQVAIGVGPSYRNVNMFWQGVSSFRADFYKPRANTSKKRKTAESISGWQAGNLGAPGDQRSACVVARGESLPGSYPHS
jgi:hypothetical protein